MKRTSKELKRIARDILNNRYTIPMGAFVTASLIPAVIELPFSISAGNYPTTSQLIITALAEFLILLIGQVLSIGVYRVHLNMTRGKEFRFLQIFDPFRSNAERYFGASFLYFLLALASCLPAIFAMVYFDFAKITPLSISIAVISVFLTIILVLLFALNYQMVFFILLDQPQLKVLSAFKESRLRMKGNKKRLLYILLSFLGWDVLILCSFGIASLWICPYQNETLTAFYLDCMGELDQIPVRDYNRESAPSSNYFS